MTSTMMIWTILTAGIVFVGLLLAPWQSRKPMPAASARPLERRGRGLAALGRHRVVRVAGAVAVVAAVALGIRSCGAPTINGHLSEFPDTFHTTMLEGIAAGPDGALWFTDSNGSDFIGRITMSGEVTVYHLPTIDGAPWGITAGPDGALWFTEQHGNRIGRITTSGQITEYPLPMADNAPVGITTGPDGALWFTERDGDAIGRITTSGQLREFPLANSGAAQSYPIGITAGPDGALWFAENFADRIGRITTSGQFSQFPISPAGVSQPSDAPTSEPYDIVAGPDGALWFTEQMTHSIGRITTSGQVHEYSLPSQYEDPSGITVGPDGALWFVAQVYNSWGVATGGTIGRITVTGQVSEAALPNASGVDANGIAVGSDHALWFTENEVDRIGRFTPAS